MDRACQVRNSYYQTSLNYCFSVGVRHYKFQLLLKFMKNRYMYISCSPYKVSFFCTIVLVAILQYGNYGNALEKLKSSSFSCWASAIALVFHGPVQRGTSCQLHSHHRILWFARGISMKTSFPCFGLTFPYFIMINNIISKLYSMQCPTALVLNDASYYYLFKQILSHICCVYILLCMEFHIICYRWYPGCSYVRSCKGANFIRSARQLLTDEQIIVSNTLHYSRGDLTFLGKLRQTTCQPPTIISRSLLKHLSVQVSLCSSESF